jgi:hypothetical protein
VLAFPSMPCEPEMAKGPLGRSIYKSFAESRPLLPAAPVPFTYVTSPQAVAPIGTAMTPLAMTGALTRNLKRSPSLALRLSTSLVTISSTGVPPGTGFGLPGAATWPVTADPPTACAIIRAAATEAIKWLITAWW